MKKYFILVFAMIQFTLFAEEKKDFLIGVNFSPEMAYRTITDSKTPAVTNTFNSISSPKFSYTTGFVFNYFVSNNFFIESGLQYSNKGNKIETDGFLVEGNSIPVKDTVYSSYLTRYNIHFLGIPILFGGVFGNKKVKFYATLGVHFDFLLSLSNVNVVERFDGERIKSRSFYNDNENFNRFNITPTISAGIDYSITEKTSLRVAPVFRFSALDFSKSNLSKVNFYNLGVNLSYFMKI